MTAVTLIVNSVTFTFNPGDVKSISSETVSNPDVDPIPLSPPMSSLALDLSGVSKNITVSGVLTTATSTRTSSGTVTSVLAQKEWLERIQNGNQGLLTFTSNYEEFTMGSGDASISTSDSDTALTTPTQGMINRMRFEEIEGEPEQLSFTFTIRIGGI